MRILNPAPGFPFGSPFGDRRDPFGSGERNFHGGLDIKTPTGTVLQAPTAGRVRVADHLFGASGNPCGLQLTVDGPDGVSWSFCHLDAVYVSAGDSVEAGQLVAESGSSGSKADGSPSVTGPHLHFVVKLDGELVDPATVISAGGGASLVKLAVGLLILRELVRLLIGWRKGKHERA